MHLTSMRVASFLFTSFCGDFAGGVSLVFQFEIHAESSRVQRGFLESISCFGLSCFHSENLNDQRVRESMECLAERMVFQIF